MGMGEWEAPGANVEAVRAAKENMEDKAADETDTNWRGNYSDDKTEKVVQVQPGWGWIGCSLLFFQNFNVLK